VVFDLGSWNIGSLLLLFYVVFLGQKGIKNVELHEMTIKDGLLEWLWFFGFLLVIVLPFEYP